MINSVGPTRIHALPSIQRVRELITYDPLSGIFLWKVDRGGRYKIVAGDRAGSQRSDGYRFICIDGVRIGEHRLAWAWMTGEWPVYIVDHADTNPSNNSWVNLRAANGSESAANKNRPSNNQSGFKGVRYRKGRWHSQICVKGKHLFLGSFDTATQARDAYNTAALRHFGEYARVEE